jgi:hypothetical protein
LKLALPQRIARRMRAWASRRVEKRLRAEWDSYDHRPEVRLKGFQGGDAPTIQVNFYRHPRRVKKGG